MKIFGMVTTVNSWEYTSYALKSFFKNTRLEEGEKVFLIDNDNSFDDDASWFNPALEIIKNDEPLSFAANVNKIMEIARGARADLFFLNNDLIFTQDWILPLLIDEPFILSPLSNREVQYNVGGIEWKNTLKLSDYLGREAVLKEIAKQHKADFQGYRKVISLPFFCIRIPFRVYETVGPMDESFGRGGAEDNDYCIRAILAGFDVKYALQSFVLHFSGKSTWAGGETQEETEIRCKTFRDVFEQKWGTKLLDVMINLDSRAIEKSPELMALAKREDYRAMIEILRRS